MLVALIAELSFWAVVAVLVIGGHWWMVAGAAFLYLRYYPDSEFWKLKQADARYAALAEASHGAATVALAVLAMLRISRLLPAWFPLAALAVVIWGSLRLFNGAKFSVGWRDPKLIAGALAEAGIGAAIYMLVWNPPAWVPRDLLADIAAVLAMAAPYGEWAVSAIVIWCAVSGLTKLVLVLRGFPAWPLPDPGTPHGGAGFWNPKQPGSKL